MVEKEPFHTNGIEIEIISSDVERMIQRYVDLETSSVEQRNEHGLALLKLLELDRNNAVYIYLHWLDKILSPRRILYPRAGQDIIPVLAFGPQKSVYLQPNGSEEEVNLQNIPLQQVIADTASLPFQNNIFDVVCDLNPSSKTGSLQMHEYSRVLGPQGMVVLSNSILHLEENDGKLLEYKNNPRLEEVDVPDEFQMTGDSITTFTVFQKKDE